VAPDVRSVMADRMVDAVLIASPTSTHVELITAAAQAGKAALCEKPIDLDIERGVRCKVGVAHTGVAVQIGFNRHYDRSHRAVRDTVRRREIGALERLMNTSRDVGTAPLS
jgi:myo-inositol 2-dehydrogenase/D-chiro-inositol 1-dehydrogenase